MWFCHSKPVWANYLGKALTTGCTLSKLSFWIWILWLGVTFLTIHLQNTATFLILISLYNKLKQKPKNTCFNKRRKRHHPLWKRFPLRALFPHLNLGRPTEIDYRIQDNLKEYVHKLMLPVEDWDKEEIAPQIDSVLSRTTGIPCSKCWTGQDPGFTRFWTYIYGDRNGANPKSVFEQLTEEFSRTKLTKRERCWPWSG